MVNTEQLEGATAAIKELIAAKACGPILIRLAWHDAGTYDDSIGAAAWPKCGGANGSIRFDPEILHGANAGLKNALILLEPIKAQFPEVGYADLFQLASATAVEVMGGPTIPMKYGRKDATGPDMCHPEGNLPAGAAPWPTGGDAAGHLRAVFHRMGLSDQDIVALSGAHCVGRAHASRSGLCHKAETKYTAAGACPMGTAATGGASWTPEWTKFDNSYFQVVKDPKDEELLALETDTVLFKDPEFLKYAEKYAEDQDAFFADYAVSHAKLSELGVAWEA
uniref:Ascorbate peroxidase n=1 Tax=Ulva fasciata TaxID=111617 RepID=Q2V8E8_9CHLO|nr:ascorbate peroxidase [Ulva fasciata]